jgi:hyperosmotically inducible protein
MKRLTFSVVMMLSVVGCNASSPQTTTPQTTTPQTTTVQTTTVHKPEISSSHPAESRKDNTHVNQRDRSGEVKTPIDQNENQKDIDVTANIRKQVVAAKMSSNAHNSKIITQDGKVTLRGPVASDDEKRQIEAIATGVAGAGNVDNQLDVQP